MINVFLLAGISSPEQHGDAAVRAGVCPVESGIVCLEVIECRFQLLKLEFTDTETCDDGWTADVY